MPIQAIFIELISENFSHSNLKIKKIYFHDNFNNNFFSNRKHILNGKGKAACQVPVHTLINKYLELFE